MADKAKSPTLVSPPRAVVLLIALVYLVLAVAGMITVGWDEFGWEDPVRLFGVLGISTLLNIVHGCVGAIALVAALRRGATAFAPPAGIAFTAMAAFGIVSRVFGGEGDPLNLTWWNVVLYALSAAACGYVFATGVRTARR